MLWEGIQNFENSPRREYAKLRLGGGTRCCSPAEAAENQANNDGDQAPTESAKESTSDTPQQQDEPTVSGNQNTFLAVLSSHLISYFDSTTVHGFKYILTGESGVERVTWAGAVILAFTGAFVLINTYVSEVVTDPITMTLSKIPVGEVTFPAVTVDAGTAVDHLGYVRKALGRVAVDERDVSKSCFVVTACHEHGSIGMIGDFVLHTN